MMPLARDVQHRLTGQAAQSRGSKFWKRKTEAGEHCGVVGFGSGGAKDAVNIWRLPPKSLAKGLDQMPFDLRRERVVTPRGQLRVERCDDCIRRDPHAGRRRIEQPEVPRMGRVDLGTSELFDHKLHRLERIARPSEVKTG